MIDTPENRKRVAKELRRGDHSVLWLNGWTDEQVEDLRADMERQVRRKVTAERMAKAPMYVTLIAKPKVEVKEPTLWE